MRRYGPVTQSFPVTVKRHLDKGSIAVSVTYILATAVFVFSSVVVSIHPHRTPDTAAGFRVPDTAVCVRASRYANYATARLVVGTPAREVEALIRLDKVVKSPSTATQIWASMVSQSRTLDCVKDGSNCTDVAMVQPAGLNSASSWMIAHFSIYADYNDYSITGGTLGLKGMIYLVRGYDYYLTTTHFCWTPHAHTVTNANQLDAKVSSDGYLEDANGSLGICNGTTARLFPYHAASEFLWLALTDRYLFEHDEKDLALRREVVSSGTLCCNGNSTLYRSLLLYSAQCARGGSCQTDPSAPYRRLLARHTAKVQLPYDTDNATINIAEANTMSRLPAILSSDAATWIAVAQLGLLVLVAAVSFVRGSQKAVSSTYILHLAFDRCINVPRDEAFDTCREVVVNALIGVLAVSARLVVLVESWTLLNEDNAHRVVVSETVGCIVSITHFLLRNAGFFRETPLTKLGGPMSTVDVSCAILVALAETPLLATRQSFSSVGRMLASLLVLVSGVQTFLYSSAACCMTAVCVSHETSAFKGFVSVLYISSVLWLMQASCVAVTLCTVFVYPFVYSITRTTTGNIVSIHLCALFGFIGTALPTINRVALKFARDVNNRSKKRD